MSKKDYQAIAMAVYRTRIAVDESHGGALNYVTSQLADVLSADNSRFDRERFVEACETGKTRGMKQAR